MNFYYAEIRKMTCNELSSFKEALELTDEEFIEYYLPYMVDTAQNDTIDAIQDDMINAAQDDNSRMSVAVILATAEYTAMESGSDAITTFSNG